MGFSEVLTIAFIVLKLMGFIDWNWFFVLLPEIIALGLYFLWFAVAIGLVGGTARKIRKISKK